MEEGSGSGNGNGRGKRPGRMKVEADSTLKVLGAGGHRMFLGFREHPRDEIPLGETAACDHAAV